MEQQKSDLRHLAQADAVARHREQKESRPTVVARALIHIKPSPTADMRSCDWSKVSQEELCASSVMHREDVRQGFAFFSRMMMRQAELHDHDKLSDIEGFHRDFKTGFAQTEWWDKHRKINRHHLLQEDGVPEDVNLIDVLDLIVDCTMAGLARSGSIYPITLSPEILQRAFDNTCELLKVHVAIERPIAPEVIVSDRKHEVAEAIDFHERCGE